MANPGAIRMIEFVDKNTKASLLRVRDPERIQQLFNDSDLIKELYTMQENPTVTILVDAKNRYIKILLAFFSTKDILETDTPGVYDFTPYSKNPTLVKEEEIAYAFRFLMFTEEVIQATLEALHNYTEDFDTWANRQLNIRQQWKNKYRRLSSAEIEERQKQVNKRYSQNDEWYSLQNNINSETGYEKNILETYPFPTETVNMTNTEFDKWLRVTNPLPPLKLQLPERNMVSPKTLFKNTEGGRRTLKRKGRKHKKTQKRR